MEGLEQKIHRPQAQGALGIGETVVGGENDDIGVVPPGPQLLEHLDAVHPGHFQVRDDQRRVISLYCVQSGRTVGGLAHHHTVQCRPVHRQDDPFADHLFIFHNQYFQHGIPPFEAAILP